jgi:diguanylate cyclase (GGDEF)-like protein
MATVPNRSKLSMLLAMPGTAQARLVENTLLDTGFTANLVSRASGLHDAMDILRTGPVSVCLVHTSLEDGTSAFDFIDRAIKLPSPPPVIVLADSNDMDLDEECQRRGAAFFIDIRSLSGEVLERAIRYTVSAARETADLKYSIQYGRLTGALNRQAFFDRLQQALFRAERTEYSVCVVCLDLQRFERINEEHGHAVGDQVLMAVANRLKSSIRKADMVARFGSDEFGCLIENFGDDENALIIVKKLILGFKVPVRVDGKSFDVSAAAGGALHPKHGDTPDTVLHAADEALSQARKTAADTGEPAYVIAEMS